MSHYINYNYYLFCRISAQFTAFSISVRKLPDLEDM